LIAFDRLPMSAIWAEEVLCCGFQVQQLIIGRLPEIAGTKKNFISKNLTYIINFHVKWR
jgi:hypothetical protein